MIKFGAEKTIQPKILLNIGSCFDIPTGTVVTGNKGESIIKGGLGSLNAVVGMGNRFKSTIAHYMVLSALNRLLPLIKTQIITYDTEINMSYDSLGRLLKNFENINEDNIFSEELWSVSDKSNYLADEWVELLKSYTKQKIEDKNSKLKYELFNHQGKPYEHLVPSFVEIDSLTEFEPSATVELQDKHSIGESGGNTLFMKQGLAKTRFLAELPRLANNANLYMVMTAHVSKDLNIQTGPINIPPPKKLQFLKAGDKIKGVSDKFFFLLWNAWYITEAKPMLDSNKQIEYPMSEGSIDNDLHLVRATQLRCKTGPTGYSLSIVVSQTEGVIPEMTEFINLKEANRFGLGGNPRSFYLELYPECKLNRMNIRKKLKTDPKLRRAMNITSELLQVKNFYPQYADYMCTPQELYEDIKKNYDWDILLNTRGWWHPLQYKHPIPFLSIIDLLKMRKGEYSPYWLKK